MMEQKGTENTYKAYEKLVAILEAENEALRDTYNEIMALAIDCKAINLEHIDPELKWLRLKSKLFQLVNLLKQDGE